MRFWTLSIYYSSRLLAFSNNSSIHMLVPFVYNVTHSYEHRIQALVHHWQKYFVVMTIQKSNVLWLKICSIKCVSVIVFINIHYFGHVLYIYIYIYKHLIKHYQTVIGAKEQQLKTYFPGGCFPVKYLLYGYFYILLKGYLQWPLSMMIGSMKFWGT